MANDRSAFGENTRLLAGIVAESQETIPIKKDSLGKDYLTVSWRDGRRIESSSERSPRHRDFDTSAASIPVSPGPYADTSILRKTRLVYLNVFLAVGTVLARVIVTISIAVYMTGMRSVDSDAYVGIFTASFWNVVMYVIVIVFVKLFWKTGTKILPSLSHMKSIIMAGFLFSLKGLFTSYASPAKRTPPYLIGILGSTVIPYTIVCRYVMMKKGVSIRRLVCTGVVIVGLIVSLIPQFSGFDKDASDLAANQTTAERILWPIVYSLAFLPYGILNVLMERELKKEHVDSLTFLAWSTVFYFVCVGVMFWTDFIPEFGMAQSVEHFRNNTVNGIRCMYFGDENCNAVGAKSWIFSLSMWLSSLVPSLLIQYAEGAVYAVVIMALVTPLATLFWTFFKDNGYSLDFDPEFTKTTAFVLAGLVIIIPAVAAYTYYSMKDEEVDAISLDEPDSPDGSTRVIINQSMTKSPKLSPLRCAILPNSP